MPIPRVAIVGRPNVGKSSLMNMLAGAKVSIVDPTAGTTRDRVSAIVDLDPPFRGDEPKVVEFVDTGGFGAYVAAGGRYDEVGNDLAKLTGDIETQIAMAVEGADLVLFCVDAQAGVTPQDQEIARLLREHRLGRQRDAKKKREGETKRGKKAGVRAGAEEALGMPRTTDDHGQSRLKGPPVRIVATKVDGPRWEAHAHELSELGFGDPIPVSAKNNYFRREFVNEVWSLVPRVEIEERDRSLADLYVAIIGKRNAGKSTLVNRLAGEARMIVSEIPGTTRDAVDVKFELDGRVLVAIDTAGLRRKRSFQGAIEWYALDRLQRAVDRSDVVLLLIDATEKISQVDEHLAMMAQKAFKPAIIVVNKWDAAEGRVGANGKVVTPKAYETYLRRELGGLAHAPIAFMSGQTGLNVKKTIDLAFELREQSRSRVTTGKLNRLVRSILDTRGPTDIRGRFAKVFYVAQTGVEPPTITMVVNHPDLFTPAYLRFLMNRFREEMPFSEVPIRIVVRARRQTEDDLRSADEGGEGQTIRVTRGRKGVEQRVQGKRVGKAAPATAELGEELLSDEHSKVVEIDQFSDDAEDYFEDEEK
ncbi:GTPase Der [Phycisphaerales bacterium]|nr:GTPase Der [Phycisphaerales bacterium]